MIFFLLGIGAGYSYAMGDLLTFVGLVGSALILYNMR